MSKSTTNCIHGMKHGNGNAHRTIQLVGRGEKPGGGERKREKKQERSELMELQE